MRILGSRLDQLTGLLNMSLLAWGATPPGILGAFARRVRTPLILNGPDRVATWVSVTLCTSMAEGGAMTTVGSMVELVRWYRGRESKEQRTLCAVNFESRGRKYSLGIEEACSDGMKGEIGGVRAQYSKRGKITTRRRGKFPSAANSKQASTSLLSDRNPYRAVMTPHLQLAWHLERDPLLYLGISG